MYLVVLVFVSSSLCSDDIKHQRSLRDSFFPFPTYIVFGMGTTEDTSVLLKCLRHLFAHGVVCVFKQCSASFVCSSDI